MINIWKKIKKHGFIGSSQIITNKLLTSAREILNIIQIKLFKKPLLEYQPGENNIEESLTNLGIIINDYTINKDKYNSFKTTYDFGPDFYGGSGSINEEKLLEHFVAYNLLEPKPEERYVDIAASESPWAKLLHSKGYNATAIDLKRSSKFGSEKNYKVMDATNTTFQNKSIDLASLQCAYEMFLGNNDTRLLKELSRILSPSGRCVILPLYLDTHYCGFSSIEYIFQSKYHDPGVNVYLDRANKGIPFSRRYDVAALQSRVLKPLKEFGLQYKLYRVTNAKTIEPNLYLYFMLYIYRAS